MKNKLKLTDVFVVIDSKEKENLALDILRKHNQPIDDVDVDGEYKYLLITDISGYWWIGKLTYQKTEITLEQLDFLLTYRVLFSVNDLVSKVMEMISQVNPESVESTAQSIVDLVINEIK